MTDDNDDPGITTAQIRVVYRNAFVTVYDDDVVFADGNTGRHLRIIEAEGRRGVAALAVNRSKVALVRTYRYPLAAWQWGLPRGFATSDDPAVSIERELTEEIGRAPDDLRPLIDVTPNSGLLASRVRIFFAHYSMPMATPIDTREVAAVRWVEAGRLMDEIRSGAIDDAFTISAVGAAMLEGVQPFAGVP